MSKLYTYTILKPDGTSQNERRPKMSLEELQLAVGGYIEIVPTEYYKHQKWGKATVYVNEEGRFRADAEVNQHFKNLGQGFYIVGIALLEQVAK